MSKRSPNASVLPERGDRFLAVAEFAQNLVGVFAEPRRMARDRRRVSLQAYRRLLAAGVLYATGCRRYLASDSSPTSMAPVLVARAWRSLRRRPGIARSWDPI